MSDRVVKQVRFLVESKNSDLSFDMLQIPNKADACNSGPFGSPEDLELDMTRISAI